MTLFTRGLANAGFIITEADGHYSRDNAVLAKGSVDPVSGVAPLSAGTVLKLGSSFSLSTTGNTHTNTVLDGLASVVGLITGETYFVDGTGIHSSFTYNGSNSAQALDVATTATATGVSLTITQGTPLVVETTANINTDTSLNAIADVTKLIPGQIYTVRGAVADFPNSTTFTFEYPAPTPSGDTLTPAVNVTLNAATNATATAVPIQIYLGVAPIDLVPWAAAGDTADSILVYQTDPTAGDQNVVVIRRNVEVNGHKLVYPPGLDVAVRTKLTAIGIVVRD